MVQNSYKKLDIDLTNKLHYFLFYLFSNKSKRKDFKIVLDSVFSNAEKIMLIKRVGIIYLLLKGIKKYKISQTMGVTRATIDKFSLLIEKNTTLYKSFDKLIKKKQIIQLFEELIDALYGPGTPGIDWSSARKRREKLIRKKDLGV